MKTPKIIPILFTLLTMAGCGGGGSSGSESASGGGSSGGGTAGGGSTTPDTTAPTASFSPVGSASGVALSAAIEVTFNEALKDTTVTNDNLDVKPTSASDGASDVCSSWSLSADKKVAACTHGDLAPGVSYTITAGAGITDDAGNALGAVTSSFTTTGTVGANNPIPRILVPSSTGTGTVFIFFDRAVDPATATTDSIQVIKEGETANLCTAITMGTGDTVATCTLSEGFSCVAGVTPPTKYNFTVNTDVRSAAGGHSVKPLDDYFSDIDDGFNNAATMVEGCWVAVAGSDGGGGGTPAGETIDINDGSIGRLYMKGGDGDLTDELDDTGPFLAKTISIGAPYGVTIKVDILDGTSPLTTTEGGRLIMSNEVISEAFFAFFSTTEYLAASITGGGADELGTPSPAVVTPVYFCLTRTADGTTFTAAYDGEGDNTFTPLDLTFTMPTIVDEPDSFLLLNLIYASGGYAMEIDWVRFNIGEAACPAVDTVE